MPGFVKTCCALLGALATCAAGPSALAQTTVAPTASLQTVNAVDQDDMCIWVHPTDRSLSTVITSDKSAYALFVYDLTGAVVQEVALPGRPGNIDVRYGFPLGGELVDIVAFNDRGTSKLKVYRVDPVTRTLTRVDDNDSSLGENYGSCLYRSPMSGQYYAFTTAQTGVVNQFLLSDVNGLVSGTLVRSWSLGGKTEGCVADDETGYVYFAEESRGIWKVGAEPDGPTIPRLIAEVGDASGLQPDVEGLTLYYAANGGGYLIASSQGQGAFIAYERQDPHDFVRSFTIDGVAGTDGIDVTNVDLGPDYRAGIFTAHNTNGTPKPVQICRYEDLGLPVDAWYWDPRAANPGDPGDIGFHPSGYAEMGWRDFEFGPNVYSSPTGEKPQSKLWWHDGAWWGVLWDPADLTYRIARYDESGPSWTFVGPDVDSRPLTLSDVLSEGNTLYVASHSRQNPSGPAYLFRYTYDEPTGLYSLDAGFPTDMNAPKVEALTIAKDGAGRLWSTYESNNQIWVNATIGGDAVWGTPFVLPVTGVNVDADDISAIVAFESKVGVVWSNQVDGQTCFAWRNDADPDGTWSGPEVALAGSGGADDHVSISAFEGNVFIAVKNDETSSSEPLVYVLKRDPAGVWTHGVVGTRNEAHTRPILVIDEDNREVYVFANSDRGPRGDAIWMKHASVDDLDFGPGLGVEFIRSSIDSHANDPTSIKQHVNRESGLLVLASDSGTDRYLHGFMRLDVDNVAPVAVAAATPGTGVAPVSIQFTSLGSFDPDGAIATYWWDFGDGSRSSSIRRRTSRCT
jgi:myo-inositol-hexaphosphate 3-phosphohydrolase